MPRIAITILALCALGGLLRAQEETRKEPSREQLAKWIEQLASPDAEAREKAVQRLLQLDDAGRKELLEMLQRLAGSGQVKIANARRIRVITSKKQAPFTVRLAGPKLPATESIGGKWAGDDEEGEYTLASSKLAGRYKLEAHIRRKDGGEQQIKDEGTLAELRKKYGFLKGLSGVVLGAARPNPNYEKALKLLGKASGVEKARTAPRVGLTLSKTSAVLRHHLSLPEGAGFVVEKVGKGSRAAELGLLQYDILVRINGMPIDTPKQLEALLRREGKLEYVRRGRTLELDLARPEAPLRRGR